MIDSLSPFVKIRRELHQIPEPGFKEFKTQQYLLDYISALPGERLEIKTWRTGVLVKVKGSQPSKTYGYRADMDGLPIEEETSYDFVSTHTGYMHACGHDCHMAIGLGVLTYFCENVIEDDIVFIFQPAEEGPGGARPLLESDEFAAFRPDAIFSLHIGPEYPVGSIATKPGILFANTSELFIDFIGKGGHAAYPHRANDMVIAAAHFTTQLQTIISRNLDPLDSGVITIGKIEGGTKQNIIAGKARLEGTIRTMSMESMSTIKSRIEAFVRGIEEGFDCKVNIDYGSSYCQVYNDSAITQSFIDWVKKTEIVSYIECKEVMAGEDFGYFLNEIPGFMFWLGVNTPYGLHDSRIEPDEKAVDIGIKLMTTYLSSL